MLVVLLLRVAPVGDNKSLNYYKSVLSDGFSSSQTQQIQFASLIVARMVEGVDSPALRARVMSWFHLLQDFNSTATTKNRSRMAVTGAIQRCLQLCSFQNLIIINPGERSTTTKRLRLPPSRLYKRLEGPLMMARSTPVKTSLWKLSELITKHLVVVGG